MTNPISSEKNPNDSLPTSEPVQEQKPHDKKKGGKNPKFWIREIMEKIFFWWREISPNGLAVHRMTNDHNKLRKLDPFSFEVSHRRLAWCFRMSVFMNVTLSFALIFTASALMVAYPLKETRFALIEADSAANQVYRIEPLSEEVSGFKLFLETKAREFASNILPVDLVTQNERYGAAFAMATTNLANKFAEQYFKSGWLKDAHDKGLNRSVIIENAFVRNDSLTKNYLVTVDYVQIDRFKAADTETRKHLSVNFEMAQNPQWVEASELYKNPLGIVVLDMSISVRK